MHVASVSTGKDSQATMTLMLERVPRERLHTHPRGKRGLYEFDVIRAVSQDGEQGVKPLIHAKVSVKKYGGKVEDYMPIHDFIDSSKVAVPDIRHRAMLHSAWGVYLVERVFGTHFKNSDGKDVSTRDIAEEHVQQDLGFIPTLEDWLNTMPIEGWMSGTMKRTRVMNFD